MPRQQFFTVFSFCSFLTLLFFFSLENALGQEAVYHQGWLDKKELLPENIIYEPTIKTVQLFNPNSGANPAETADAVVSVRESGSLLLRFDELAEDGEYYEAKILHCNHDWTLSGLSSFDFMGNQYNAFRINDYEYSMSEEVPYIHYELQLPALNRSGNYLLVVYREGDEDDLRFIRRFVVYEDRVSIVGEVAQTVGGRVTWETHQLNFKVNYSNLEIPFPDRSVWVTLRQNERWDNAIYNLPPRFIRTNDRVMEFDYFNMENAFPAGNEFRTFGFRSMTGSGLNVRTIEVPDAGNMRRIYLYNDIRRGDKSFNQQQQDINGSYFVQVMGRRQFSTDADYMEVIFTLKMEEVKGDVYLMGKFTDWKLQEEYKMTYLPDKGIYVGSAILKQGMYDYAYSIYDQGEKSEGYIEGNYRLAQNTYDIIVYYRKIGDRADRVIGYRRF
ncbi:DUF5103 domain-containing protein [Algivirga pacifica]|uniref:DUF5103 domain-containing protein n=1 Tax=Algivirga pacifica TaxID=1162670 RepID=A0ABP9DAI7_9BACT